MPNLSQLKRERMLAFLQKIKDEHRDDDDMLIALGEIESELTSKKYGLVWEQHEEAVDVMMRDNVPVFTEVPEREITAAPGQGYNFILEGDNLHSLRLLEKTHKGKIDIIYIDPPYNRGGNDFRYEDTFVEKQDGFRHSKWLSFMESRLRIAWQLLKSDGVIFISIDDFEMGALRMLCDDVFGEAFFLCNIVWQKRYSRENREAIGDAHEYRRQRPHCGRNIHRQLYLWICAGVADLRRTESIRKRAFVLSLYSEEVGRSFHVRKGRNKMKKRIIASTAFAACLALCAAMWPQNDPAVETSVLPTPPAVIAAQPEVSEMPEIEEIIMPEEEKTDVTQPEPIEEADAALEPIPVQTPLVSEVQTAPKQSATPLQERGPAPTSLDRTPDNMVYVPGFGWLESQGPNHVEYAEDMYENGNKIGIMG